MKEKEDANHGLPVWSVVVIALATLLVGLILGWFLHGVMMHSMMRGGGMMGGMMNGNNGGMMNGGNGGMMNGMGMMRGNGGEQAEGMMPWMCRQMAPMLEATDIPGEGDTGTESAPSSTAKEPTRKKTGSSGRELYMRYCASCHGENLSGDPPRIPSLETVGQKRSREFIQRRIQEGQGMMPAFDFLSGPQQNAIVSFLLGEADTAVEDVNLPPAKLGEVLFASNCAQCHRKRTTGPQPEGIPRGMMGMRMMEPAPLAGATKRFTRSQFAEILNWGPMYMPSFRNLSREEKEALWAFARSLEGEGEASRPTMMEMMIRMCKNA